MIPKILFVQSQTEVGGAEISQLAALERLDRSRFRTAVATLGFGSGDYPERLREAGIEVFELCAGRARNPFSWARTVVRLARLARRGGFRALVSNGYHPHFYAGPAARLAGARSVLFCRDFPHSAGQVPLVERAAFFLGAGVYLVASQAMKKSVAERTGGRRPVMVVPNGVRLEKFRVDPGAAAAVRSELGLSPEDVIITVAGRLQPWKGQHLFLEAAALVSREVPAARFLVVGEALFGQDQDYPDKLREQARGLGIAERVIFTGNRPDMPALYAASDVVAHSSVRPEPFGRVIVEAMAASRPVVVARAGGAAEILVEGENGLGYEPGDAADFAGRIVELCRDPGLRERLGRAGRERVERCYSTEVSAGALAEALEAAIGAGAGETPKPTALTMFTAAYPPATGGVADHSRLLAGELAGRGLDVEVVTTVPAGAKDSEERFPVRRLSGSWSVSGARKMARTLPTGAAALFQYVPHLYGRLGVTLGAALFPLFCRFRGTRAVTVFHEVCVPWSLHPLRLLQSVLHRLQAFLAIAASNGVVFSNRRDARRCRPATWLFRRPWRVLASGPTAPQVRLDEEKRREARTRWSGGDESLIAVYGLASRTKRYDLALEALGLLLAEGHGIRLLMLGDQGAGDRKYCDEVREEARRMGLEDQITWSGPLDSGEVSTALAAADVMWHLNSGGLTVRSGSAACAFAQGLPVVAFGGLGLDSCFRPGENVLMAQEISGRALARVTASLLSSPEQSKRLRSGARQLYAGTFAWPVVTEGYVNLMRRAGVPLG